VILRGVCAAALAIALPLIAMAQPSPDAILGDALRWQLAPSVSLAIVKNGTIVYSGAYGSADLDARRPATTATRYPIGSLGNLFIAVAVMQLAASGRLRLDDSLRTYLPDDVPFDVTVRELLPPREDNVNYDLLGKLVERIAGEPLATYLSDRVFHPANMTQTWVGEPPSWLPLASGYYQWRDAFGAAAADADAWKRPCCNSVSTAADVARFDVALFNGTLVSAAWLRTMRAAFISTHKAGILAIGQEGASSGYDASNVLFPERGYAIVTLANCAGFAAPAVLNRVIALSYPELAASHDGGTLGNAAVDARLRAYLAAHAASLGPASVVEFLSSSESAGANEYRYLVDFGGTVKSAFFTVNARGEIDGFWLH